MGRLPVLFAVLVAVSGLAFSNSRWWNACSKHWNECQKLYLEWKGKKVEFSQRELQCVKTAKDANGMLSCLSEVKAEQRKFLRRWKLELRRAYIRWLREDRLQQATGKTQIPQKVTPNNNSTRMENVNQPQK